MKTDKLIQLQESYMDELTKLQAKYSEQLLETVQDTLEPQYHICSANGSLYLYDKKEHTDIDNEYVDILQELVWSDGIDLPYKLSKTNILTDKAAIEIKKLYTSRGISSFYSSKEFEKLGLVSLYTAHKRYLEGAGIDSSLIKEK